MMKLLFSNWGNGSVVIMLYPWRVIKICSPSFFSNSNGLFDDIFKNHVYNRVASETSKCCIMHYSKNNKLLYVYLNSRKQIFAERSIFGVYTNIRAILNSRRWLPKIMNSRTPIRLKIREITLTCIIRQWFLQAAFFHFTYFLLYSLWDFTVIFNIWCQTIRYCTEQRHSICLAGRLWQTKEYPLTCVIFHSFKQR
jgi:hypothetical protein